jgi:hypothetical protein
VANWPAHLITFNKQIINHCGNFSDVRAPSQGAIGYRIEALVAHCIKKKLKKEREREK